MREAWQIDQNVGLRIKERRRLLGLSQTNIGDALGVSFQQVQKYENGTNRISAGKLALIAEFLEVPVGYFFDSDTSESGATRASLEVAKAFSRITDPRLRTAASAAVHALAEADAAIAQAGIGQAAE